MKKIIAILTAVFITTTAWAQSPEKMTYQSVIRNASEQLVTNQDIGMQISILQGSTSGTPVYVETHSTATNSNGLITIEIGTGTTSYDFSSIVWANGPYFITTETDPTTAGGTAYTISGTSQLLSVPYSLHAKIAGTADYNNLTNQPSLFDGDYNSLTSLPTLFDGDWNNLTGTVPNISTFTNDAGFITSYTETDPIFTAWDKSTGISITESQISDFGSYLETEVDGSTTNEIQNLNSVLNTGSNANSVAINNLKIGQSSTCDASTEGNQRYNSITKKMEYCDGTQWIPYSIGTPCTPQPTVADAGYDQVLVVNIGTAPLSANSPIEGTGEWTILSGIGGSFVNNTLATTDFTGDSGQTYILQWAITNPCYSSTDDVKISFTSLNSITFTMSSGDYQIIVDTVALVHPELIDTYGTGEFYTGANSYYSNFDLRISKRVGQADFDGLNDTEANALIDERVGEGIIMLLKEKFPNAVTQYEGNDIFYTVNYKYFSNDYLLGEASKKFQCITPGPKPEFIYVEE